MIQVKNHIINSSRESANKRSIELYGKAIEQAIAAYQVNNPNEEIKGLYKAEDNKLIDLTIGKTIDGLNINYEGSRMSSKRVVVYEDGSIYMNLCSIGSSETSYTYGTYRQTYKPQYYRYVPELCTTLEFSISALPGVDIQGRTVYLGFDSSNATSVTDVYVCLVRQNNEYCLKNEVTRGEHTSQYYGTNVNILREIYADIALTTSEQDHNNYCFFGDNESFCELDDLWIDLKSDGCIWVYDYDRTRLSCEVGYDGMCCCYN